MITEQWLEEKDACLESVEVAKENNWIGLSIDQSIDLLIWSKRYPDANWLLARYMNKTQNVQYAIFAAEQVLDIFENKYPDDQRPRKAIEAAKEYLKNPCDKTKAAAYAYADAAAYAYAADAAAYAATAAAATAAAAYAAYAYAAAAYAAAATAAAAAATAAAAALRIKILKYGLSLLYK